MSANMTALKITVLVENTAGRKGLLAEHGLAYLIEVGGENILFDTGQGLALEHNAKALGVDLHNLDAVILSHGHYDHAGGLHFVSAKQVLAHPAVVDSKFSRDPGGGSRSVAMPAVDRQILLAHPDWIRVEAPVELPSGLRLTGPIPRLTDFEDTGGEFFSDSDCTNPDELLDDQALFFETSTGTVVILGCAHSGVINTLRAIQALTGNRPIHTVIGGMHLRNASDQRMSRTLEELHHFNVQCLMPCHCTGLPAITRMWNEFPGQCRPCFVGTVIKK